MCKIRDYCPNGHCDGVINHVGLCFHWIDEFNCSYATYLVGSAGLLADGHYLHNVETDCISLIWLSTNDLSFFLLVIQKRTI